MDLSYFDRVYIYNNPKKSSEKNMKKFLGLLFKHSTPQCKGEKIDNPDGTKRMGFCL